MGTENEQSTTEPDWEKYREHHEPVEHWELRREFLKKNYGDFTENRLLCLSKTFANMEFLGCKYPMETMEQVQELSRGIVEDYRDRKSTRIQRTFMQASDAAEKKTKGRQSSRVDINQNSQVQVSSTSYSSGSYRVNYRRPFKMISAELKAMWPIQTRFTLRASGRDEKQNWKNPPEVSSVAEVSEVPAISKKNVALQSLMRLEALDLNHQHQSEKVPMDEDVQVISSSKQPEDEWTRLDRLLSTISNVQQSSDDIEIRNAEKLKKVLKELYIMRNWNEENEATMLSQSLQACQMTKLSDFIVPKINGLKDGVFMKLDFIIGDPKNPSLIVHGTGVQKKDARRDAACRALGFLKKFRPVITIKDVERRIIERRDVVPADKDLGPKLISPRDMMKSDSAAVKIMLKWGWKGHGLGKNEDGMLFPIDTSSAIAFRAGLGTKNNYLKEFETHATELLRTELESLYDYDIEFAPEFTMDERKIIHTVAERYGFKNKSYGQGNNRRLVVSRKMEPCRIFEEVTKLGGENFKYKIDLPAEVSIGSGVISQ